MRIFDALNDVDNVKSSVKYIKKYGGGQPIVQFVIRWIRSLTGIVLPITEKEDYQGCFSKRRRL